VLLASLRDIRNYELLYFISLLQVTSRTLRVNFEAMEIQVPYAHHTSFFFSFFLMWLNTGALGHGQCIASGVLPRSFYFDSGGPN
jgi:hypothetical protein